MRLETYGYALLEKLPKLRMPEDVVWNDELKRKLAKRKKVFNYMSEGNFTEPPAQGNEFPDIPIRSTPHTFRGNRKERRRRMAQARRKASKPKR
jgi:hypothetical protein